MGLGRGLGGEVVMSRGRQTDKRSESHQQRKSEQAPAKKKKNWQREVRVSPSLFFSLLLCISFTWLAVSTNRIGSGARGLGRRIKTPNAFTALIPLPHNTPRLSFFSFLAAPSLLSSTVIPFFPLSPAILRRLAPHYK